MSSRRPGRPRAENPKSHMVRVLLTKEVAQDYRRMVQRQGSDMSTFARELIRQALEAQAAA